MLVYFVYVELSFVPSSSEKHSRKRFVQRDETLLRFFPSILRRPLLRPMFRQQSLPKCSKCHSTHALHKSIFYVKRAIVEDSVILSLSSPPEELRGVVIRYQTYLSLTRCYMFDFAVNRACNSISFLEDAEYKKSALISNGRTRGIAPVVLNAKKLSDRRWEDTACILHRSSLVLLCYVISI